MTPCLTCQTVAAAEAIGTSADVIRLQAWRIVALEAQLLAAALAAQATADRVAELEQTAERQNRRLAELTRRLDRARPKP